MAKFCGKCGTKLDEATGLCPNCDADKLNKQSETPEAVEEPKPKQDMASEPEKPLSKKEVKKQRKVDKKAKKKEKLASPTFGQKVRKVLSKVLVWVILLAFLSGGILYCLVHFNLIEIPVISNTLDLLGIVSEDDSKITQSNHLEAGFTDILVVDESSAISAAREAAKILGIGNVADELTVQSINTVDGTTYYRLQQNHQGVPIMGKTMVVIADDLGNAVGFTTNTISLDRVDFGTSPDIETVLLNLTIYLNEHGYNLNEQDIMVEKYSDDKRAYYESDSGIIPVYVLQVFLNKSPLSFATVTINAQSGEIVNLNSSIYEETVTVYNADQTISANGYYDQTSGEYQLYDFDRGILIYSYENTNSHTDNATQTFITSPNALFGDTQNEISLEQEKGIKLLSNISKITDYFGNIMNWDGYAKTYCYYNDGYDSGRNAVGGNAASLASGEVVGYLSMGSVTGVDAMDIMAHEYTHIVSRKIVHWKSIEAWSESPDEPGAINEGYSDIFGEILESQLTQSEPDWVNGSRVISNPMSQNYPAVVGEKAYEKFESTDGIKWGMSTGGGNYTDYSHGFSTIVSHCAYLMYNGVNHSCEAIDLYNLARLWYNTLLTLPSNCTFVILRENMELTAEILGFSESQKHCISSAFDEVGIVKQETGEETYSTESTLLVLDKNGEAYMNCTIQISGNKFRGLFKTGLWKEKYIQEVRVSNTESIAINLPKGDYVITVTDNADKGLSCQKPIKARTNGKLTEIIVATNFGGDSVIQLPIKTTSDERDIVLVLDVSGSMSGTPMEETKKASVNFINTILDEDASIGIVTYDNSASMLSDFSVNKSVLTNAVSNIWDGGGTNIEAGLAEARSMLGKSSARKKIIVLMSDGEPNDGKEGDDLVAYADELKDDGIIIYTLGFFENMGGYKSSAQLLMEGIASDGCHYEVASADDLVFFFEDVADQINGQKYIYIRIACPVDVTVTYKGETLCSAEDDLNVRTDFGTLTFEDNENISGEKQDDRIKVLRLKEGADYDVQIVGTGHGIMDYTIGFMDENGDYSDFRRFENIKITRRTTIDTVAAVSKESVLKIDKDGDGKYDLKLRAAENSYGEEIKESILIYILISGIALLFLAIVLFFVRRNKKKQK